MESKEKDDKLHNKAIISYHTYDYRDNYYNLFTYVCSSGGPGEDSYGSAW